MVAVKPAVSTTPVSLKPLNPFEVTVTSYVPGGRRSKRYAPSAPVVVVCSAISAVLLTVTVAFGTPAPEASVTTPAIFPVVATCPIVNPGMNPAMSPSSRTTRTNTDSLRFLISPPPPASEVQLPSYFQREAKAPRQTGSLLGRSGLPGCCSNACCNKRVLSQREKLNTQDGDPPRLRHVLRSSLRRWSSANVSQKRGLWQINFASAFMA